MPYSRELIPSSLSTDRWTVDSWSELNRRGLPDRAVSRRPDVPPSLVATRARAAFARPTRRSRFHDFIGVGLHGQPVSHLNSTEVLSVLAGPSSRRLREGLPFFLVNLNLEEVACRGCGNHFFESFFDFLACPKTRFGRLEPSLQIVEFLLSWFMLRIRVAAPCCDLRRVPTARDESRRKCEMIHSPHANGRRFGRHHSQPDRDRSR